MQREATAPTIWAVECPTDGLVYLTEAEYSCQLGEPERGWQCPRCGGAAEWDDATWEAARGDIDLGDDAPAF